MNQNALLRDAIVFLERHGRKKGAPVWEAASRALAAGSSKRIEVNVARISKVTEPAATVLVAGKVLGNGRIDKKVVVGAYSFSRSARKKIADAGGKAMGIREFVERYPEGSGVKLVG